MSYDPDEQFAQQLAVLEDRIASGGLHAADTQIGEDSAISARLHDALDCLQVLDRIWPRHTETSAPALPRKVGRFTLIRELGRGGFGIVHLAEDAQLGRDVAVKLQRPEAVLSPDARRRFLKEAKAAAPLSHPNLVTVFDSGEDGLWCWIASEVVRGPSLGAYLAALSPSPPSAHSPTRPSVPIEAACRLVAKLADGVAHAHLHNVLHRDIKPNNVLLQPDVPRPASLDDYTPKLTDFGLARLLEQEPGETRTGARLGTPAYMAPEQIEGKKAEIGEATDVYGLGVLLYELLAGHSPFAADTETEILRRVLLEEPPLLRKARPEVSRDLEAVVLKALEKSPGKRYVSAHALADDLRRALNHQPTEARPLTRTASLLNRARRHPAVCLAIAAGFAAFAMFLIAGDFALKNRQLAGYCTVRFDTQPSGAQLAFAPIDPLTGDPIEDKVVYPRKPSPVELSLPAGDYLVVAVLPDGRFNERFRHVPSPESEVPRDTRQHLWVEHVDGGVDLLDMKIPEKDVTKGMVLIEDPARPKDRKHEAFAPFYLAPLEVKFSECRHARPDIQSADGTRDGLDHAAEVGYDCAVAYAERNGWRLPSPIEFDVALARCLPVSELPPSQAVRAKGFGPVGVPENDVTDTVPPIIGLRSNVAEWTTGRKPRDIPKQMYGYSFYYEARVIRGGTATMIGKRDVFNTDIRGSDDTITRIRFFDIPGVGFRCARSARPRFLDAPAGQ